MRVPRCFFYDVVLVAHLASELMQVDLSWAEIDAGTIHAAICCHPNTFR